MKNQTKIIKELATYFDQELQRKIPITVLPTGGLVYKNFLVKQLTNGNWGVFNIDNKDLINQYYLKSCALMSAKFYNNKQYNSCSEIKELDNGYWSNFCDTLIFTNNIKTVAEDKYLILLTRLEESNYQTDYFKERISVLFKLAFV